MNIAKVKIGDEWADIRLLEPSMKGKVSGALTPRRELVAGYESGRRDRLNMGGIPDGDEGVRKVMKYLAKKFGSTEGGVDWSKEICENRGFDGTRGGLTGYRLPPERRKQRAKRGAASKPHCKPILPLILEKPDGRRLSITAERTTEHGWIVWFECTWEGGKPLALELHHGKQRSRALGQYHFLVKCAQGLWKESNAWAKETYASWLRDQEGAPVASSKESTHA